MTKMDHTRMLPAQRHEVGPGLYLCSGYLTRDEQCALLQDVRGIVRAAPLFTPVMPGSGKPFSVRMTNCGSLGWVADRKGYRYQDRHPQTGDAWPPLPDHLRAIWADVTGNSPEPQACLINHYEPAARMGLHVDRDEADLSAPVVSVSLGDTCTFRHGGTRRKDPTSSFRLCSGDVVVLSGASRLAYHGVDRILPSTSTLLSKAGRINLTLRRVTAPDA